ncbi:MAG: TIM barrel protein [Verrucomicrobiales bacterium]|nr:TIM barrel protein [Verrucomicrobiales bacterium]
MQQRSSTHAGSGLSRREFIPQFTAAGALSLLGGARLFAEGDPKPPRFRIGACDWSIGRMATPDAFEVAKQIGLDGVQVSLGTAANHMALRQPEVQARYREAAKAAGLSIGSLAIGEMNNIPYRSDPRAVEWVRDSIEVCQALGCRVVLMAFFNNGDLKGDCEGTANVIHRLREVAPKAEKAGVILGIESWLSAEEHVAIIDAVGSPAVQVYYDVANATKMGYDICREIRWLGRQGLVCELHAKENGFLLGQGLVDFPRVRAALDDIGYSGWIQIEGAVPSGGNLLESYRANQRYLRAVLS